MRIFGYDVSVRRKGMELITHLPTPLNGWLGTILEPFAGAWQRNISREPTNLLTYSAVWACVTLIASDISKLWVQLVEEDDAGICTPTENPAYSPVLRTPNHFQTIVKFLEYWVICVLTRGNAYLLKERDRRGVVVALYVLDPARVQVLVGATGEVFYQLGTDYLSGLSDATVTVPASEIIHDVMVPLYHPLCGISPLTACGLAALQGLRIQENSEEFFANASQPGGILSTPQSIGPEALETFRKNWETHYAGKENAGRIAVLANDFKYTPMLPITAQDAQLIEQLKFSAETVCSVFHVPPYKIGVAPMPAGGNVEAANVEYYSTALQARVEQMEELLTKGLELNRPLSIEFDEDALLRMDAASAIKANTEGILGGLFKPNESRKKFDLKPVAGGDTVYLQQQNFSLAALAKRDAQADPFGTAAPTPAPASQPEPTPEPVKHVNLLDVTKAFEGALAA